MQFSHIPASADVTWQLCYRQKAAGTYISTWGTWRKNPKASLIYFLCVGHGGDGAAGVDARLGGGGGGSGGQTQVIIPAFLVPDTLYYSQMVPVAATAAGAIYISDIPFTSAAIGSSVFAYASGGGTATSGAAGGAGAIATAANMQAGAAGIFALLAGQAGTAGGSAAAGTALTYPTTGLLVTGGAGGGGTTSTGGNITASAPRPLISGSTTAGVPGGNGVDYVLGAFLPSGGAGGRGGNAPTAGSAGGSGGIGCGGGGGGSGTPVGAGGEGGPGLIMIAQW